MFAQTRPKVVAQIDVIFAILCYTRNHGAIYRFPKQEFARPGATKKTKGASSWVFFLYANGSEKRRRVTDGAQDAGRERPML
jgi:hypothetical protein